MLNVVSFTKLYPNSEAPTHGVFVEARLRHLAARPDVNVQVVAPVPWFPWRGARFGRYGAYARVPRREQRHGIAVEHPRFLSLPLVGMSLAPFLMLLSVARPIRRRLAATAKPVVLDAHFLYPDGVTAMLVGRWLKVPVVLTARGNDVTLWPRYRVPRALIRWATRACARVITVSESLRARLVELGVPAEQILTLRNGVDLEQFRPLDRAECRRELGLADRQLLAVGHLIERKDHQLVIRALQYLPGFELTIAGAGPLRGRLLALAAELGVADRVRLVGSLPQEALVKLYSAADLLVLSSRHEGMANVMLESLACGTPVVAMDIEGVAEIIDVPEAGEVVRQRRPEAVAAAIRSVLERGPPRSATRRHAERLGWEPVIRQLETTLRAATTAGGRALT